jgi:hypothetical protein
MLGMARGLTAALLVLAVLGPLSAQAEEGGSGHYFPGSNASFIDALPGRTGLVLANVFVFYKANAGFQLPIAGQVSANLDTTVFADSILAFYQTAIELLGGSYAFGGVVPVLWMDFSGTLVTGSGTRFVDDSNSGIGDVLLYPFMLGWTALGGDLKYDFRFGIYAPTGRFEAGSLASVGKNYWTFEPTFTTSFLSSKIGLEASAYAGVDFNTKNNTTDYKTGTQFHVDATVAEHLPLLGGLVGVGATAFYYQQISGDSGSGATLGDFKGRTVGVGPVASYAMKLNGADGAVEIKWLPELETKNRLKGNSFWIKARAVF